MCSAPTRRTAPDRRGDTHQDLFHEPFVLSRLLAGLTARIIDRAHCCCSARRRDSSPSDGQVESSGGRPGAWRRLGCDEVRSGPWARTSTRARQAHGRADRIAAATVARRLTFEGRWDDVEQALPVAAQRRLDSHLAAAAPTRYSPAWSRMATVGSPADAPGTEGHAAVDKLRALAEAAGRDPKVHRDRARQPEGPDNGRFRAHGPRLAGPGATHIGVNTMGAGLTSVGRTSRRSGCQDDARRASRLRDGQRAEPTTRARFGMDCASTKQPRRAQPEGSRL